MDKPGFLDRPTDGREAFASIDEQYGESRYGSTKYAADELFWIGYLYRYWAYTCALSSKAVYRMCNAADLHAVYYAYHTLDPQNAIQRLSEAMNQAHTDEDLTAAGVKILRKIRNGEKVRLTRSKAARTKAPRSKASRPARRS